MLNKCELLHRCNKFATTLPAICYTISNYMEKIQWKVDGMDCSNCALTIRRYLEKQGVQDVKVNFATGDVSFDMNGNAAAEKLASGIKDLGYHVASQTHETRARKLFLSTHLQRFW